MRCRHRAAVLMADAANGAFFLGIDGGGTGCRARIEDAARNVVGQGLSGPATTSLGVAEACASLERACRAAAEDAGLAPDDLARTHAGVGVAGTSRPGALEELCALSHPFADLRFISDGASACLGAHSGRDGAIVIAGTGSLGLGFVNGKELRVGGYGF